MAGLAEGETLLSSSFAVLLGLGAVYTAWEWRQHHKERGVDGLLQRQGDGEGEAMLRGRAARALSGSAARARGKSALPLALLVVSFLNAFVLSFPMNFFGKLIISEIGMSPQQFMQYYAFVFLPFSLKPLFAFLCDNVALLGSRRRAWLAASNFGTALCLLLVALAAREVWHVFALGFLQSLCEAVGGMVVGLALIDAVEAGGVSPARAQAEQTAARYMGTFCALLLALPVSGCGSVAAWSDRAAMAASAAAPLVAGVWALCLPEPRRAAPESAPTPGAAAQARAMERTALWLFLPPLVLLELLAIALGLKGNLDAAGMAGLWRGAVAVTALALVALVGGQALRLGCAGRGRPRSSSVAGAGADATGLGADATGPGASSSSSSSSSSAAQRMMLLKVSVPCLYLFVADAVPGAADAVASFMYIKFEDRCALQGLSLITSAAQIAGLGAAGAMLADLPVELALLATTLVAASAGLLDLLKTREGPVPTFAVWALVDLASGVCNAGFLLAKETVATHFAVLLQGTRAKREAYEGDAEHGLEPECAGNGLEAVGRELVREESEALGPSRECYRGSDCGGDGAAAPPAGASPSASASAQPPRFMSAGMLYSIYLTCFDVGASASGFIGAAIVSGLGITSSDFSGLATYILICANCFLVTMLLVPTVRMANARAPPGPS
jgi:hypothetical protein